MLADLRGWTSLLVCPKQSNPHCGAWKPHTIKNSLGVGAGPVTCVTLPTHVTASSGVLLHPASSQISKSASCPNTSRSTRSICPLIAKGDLTKLLQAPPLGSRGEGMAQRGFQHHRGCQMTSQERGESKSYSTDAVLRPYAFSLPAQA